MLDHVPNQPRKLSAHFVEEAGIRCFETNEFNDWYEAIHKVLHESAIELSAKVIRDIFLALPHRADDEIFDLTLIAYLIDKDLLTKDQVEEEGWSAIFPSQEEIERMYKGGATSLAVDPALRAQLERILEQSGDQMASAITPSTES